MNIDAILDAEIERTTELLNALHALRHDPDAVLPFHIQEDDVFGVFHVRTWNELDEDWFTRWFVDSGDWDPPREMLHRLIQWVKAQGGSLNDQPGEAYVCNGQITEHAYQGAEELPENIPFYAFFRTVRDPDDAKDQAYSLRIALHVPRRAAAELTDVLGSYARLLSFQPRALLTLKPPAAPASAPPPAPAVEIAPVPPASAGRTGEWRLETEKGGVQPLPADLDFQPLLDTLDPKTYNSFAVFAQLDGAGAPQQDYIQVGGSRERCLVECRRWSDSQTFRHILFGRPGGSDDIVEVAMSYGGHLDRPQRCVLDSATAAQLFACFAGATPWPDDFDIIDITHEFT